MSRIDGYEEFSFEHAGTEKSVFMKGTGPGILIMHEITGMVEQCVRLADFIAARGFTVFLPLLFGGPNIPYSKIRTAFFTARICVSREILAFAADQDSPIAAWLRALAREIRRRRPQGRGVGVIGMCLTGGFTINLMLEDDVLAPVACQPGLPFTTFGAARESLSVGPDSLRGAVARSTQVPLLCFRFDGDRISRREQFQRLEREFGSGMEGHTLPGDGHATLTIDFVDQPGHPTHQARERILQFFQERL